MKKDTEERAYRRGFMQGAITASNVIYDSIDGEHSPNIEFYIDKIREWRYSYPLDNEPPLSHTVTDGGLL